MKLPLRRCQTVGAVLLLVAACSTVAARACPFCSAAMQTLSQEIESADVTLIAELIALPPTPESDAGVAAELPAARFRILEVLRGEERLEGAEEISVVYFGDEAPDKKFMITGLAGVTGPGLDWTTPVPLSPAAVDYIKQLQTVPREGADRLAFFLQYLQHPDLLLAQDAYDEFARTPYADVIALGPRMDHAKLVGWIADPAVGPSGRRLYLTMLGICGGTDDVPMLEEMMQFDYQSMRPALAAAVGLTLAAGPVVGVGIVDELVRAEERRRRESLDALIACYLKLKGPDGLEVVNRLFMGNPRAEFKHLHSAIMALRFHGEETDVLPREKLLDSMRLALDRRDFADQVIPDLTRWEDWEVLPRLVTMFKEASTEWIRPPVVSYLLVAADVPGEVGQQAAAALEELEAIDPDAVASARSFAGLGYLQRASATPAAATEAPAEAADSADASAADGDVSAIEDSAPAAAAARRAAAKPATPPTPPNRIKIIGVPLVAVVVMLAIFAVLLRGADPRSSNENP